MSDANSNNGSLTKHMILSKTRANALTDIKAINFWGFNLKDVSIFKSMPNVEVVSMPMNYITSLEQFSFCPNLRELLLRQNLISDFQEIEHLSGLNFLTRLWLSDNPICNVSGYRKRVISMLPQLKVLDEIPITNEERFGNTLPNFPKHEYNDYNDNSHRDMPENQVPNMEGDVEAMKMSDRKKKILQIVVDEYINTAVPVSSKSIAEKHLTKISSATVRNELASLEELGYLTQFHTSGGRVPSPQAYRFYIEELMQKGSGSSRGKSMGAAGEKQGLCKP